MIDVNQYLKGASPYNNAYALKYNDGDYSCLLYTSQGTVTASQAAARKAKDSEDGISVASAVPDSAKPSALITFKSGSTTYSFGLVTKGYGDPIGSADTFQVGFYKQANTLYYKIYSANGQVLEQGPVITYKTADDNNNTSVDYLSLIHI